MISPRTIALGLAGLGVSTALAFDTIVVFNEVQYHPAGEFDPSLEFVEVYNQNAVNIDLSGWRISGKIDYHFPTGTIIEGGQHLVIAADPDALETRSGGSGFLGPFSGNLSNNSATLRIRNNNDRIMDEFTYDDRSPWPVGADGSGASLSKINPQTTSDPADHWDHSLQIGGTPGAPNFTSAALPSSNQNVALGKPVINGSSAYNNLTFDQGGFSALNVTDGSTSDIHSVNYWLGNQNSPTQFFILDLGQEYDITEIHLRNTHNQQWNDRGTLNFAVSASTSISGSRLLVSPQTILSGTLSNVANQDPIAADVFTSANGLTEVTARYLRFDSLTAVNNNAGLNEIEVYTSNNSPPPATVPTALPLSINEVPGTHTPSFWVELHNSGTSAIDLSGFILGFEKSGDYQFPVGQSIPARGFLLLENSTLALTHPPSDGDNLYLYQPEKIALLDAIRLDDRPLGRLPDGSGQLLTIGRENDQSPGSANTISTTPADIVINEIMYHHRPTYPIAGDPPTIELITAIDWSAIWHFNQSGDNLGTSWADTFHAIGGNWESGMGPLGYETSNGIPPEPVVTRLIRPQDNDPRVTTFYFETAFEISPTDLQSITSLKFSHLTDDGAVYFLNGQEIHRFDMPDGPILADTLAVNNTASEADIVRIFEVPPTFLVAGQNRISVEVHQSSIGSSDVVMGLKLDLEKALPGTNPPTAYSANDEEWIELYNRSANPVSLDNWEFEGAINFTFPANTQIQAGGYLVIARDLSAFSAKFPGVTALGDFSGSLSNSSERLLLVDQLNNPVDKVSYFDGAPWPDAADGGGSSLELRHPDLDNNTASSWQASDNTAASGWQTYIYDLTAHTPVYRPAQNNFHELRLGLLDSGEILLDDFSIIEDPDGANLELIANGNFATTNGWRLLGSHQHSHLVNEGGDSSLKLVATSGLNYLNNLIESNLTNGGSLRPVTDGTRYRISFRAKWLSGSPRFRFELYYNRLAQLVVLNQPDTHGTPGARNSSYSITVGPTLSNLLHQPAVPTANEPITISVDAEDPDGISSITLKYSVNAGSFQSLDMTSSDGLRYTATLPPQSNNALIHFYLEARDQSSNLSFAPPLGPDSRALIKVTNPNSGGSKQSIRVNMLTAEANAMHVEKDILDNHRRGCTIIIDETTIAYDSGIRLRGSMWSRNNPGRVGFNLKLPADKLYRGVHSTITLRNGNKREIAVKHIINAAGGLHDNYNDIVQFNGHLSSYNGRSRLEMTRFGTDYLKGLPGGKGTDGTVFKMEGIREFQTTQNGTRDSPKVPFPIGWVSSFDIADQGDLKEDYRHNMRINTGTDRDDYTGLIEMCKLFSLSGTALEQAAPGTINVDMWTRQFAMLSLCGVSDTYSQGNPHNLNFYTRPGFPTEPMPWDWDNHFNDAANTSIWGNKNVTKLFQRPIFTRIYHGHLHDIISRTFNATYLTPWFNHLGTCAGENYSNDISYITSRANTVLAQLPAQIPFIITTNNGNNFDHNGSTVTLAGEGWINVREITVNGTPNSLPVTWTDANSWEINVPLLPGANPLTLSALDFQGNPTGRDIITITNTSTVIPAADSNLVISEIHYHPVTNEFEEFIELLNIHPTSTIDLSGVTFTEGIDFEFPSGTLLTPGERILVVRDLAVFQAKYGNDPNVAGTFENLTKLSDKGERLRLEAPGGLTIQDFSYDDGASWPSSTDGDGPSLVLIHPIGNPDHTAGLNWRANTVLNGTPGSTDATTFTGALATDRDRDGYDDLLEYALGSDATDPTSQPILSVTPSGNFINLTVEALATADDVIITPQFSSDLNSWQNPFRLISRTSLGNGMESLFFQTDSINPSPRAFTRILVQTK
ncbi:lamin tail domain-containing protein [Verrucomicrobiaceae bacterium 227]